MTDLLFASGESNIGGVLSIRFVSVVGIDTMPEPAATGPSTPPTFRSGFRWLTCYGTAGTKTYDEKQEADDNGPLWSVTISAFLPGDSAERRAELKQLVRHRFVVEIEDNTGLRRRIGTPVESLALSYRFRTGGPMGDRRGAQLEFSGSLTAPPAVVAY